MTGIYRSPRAVPTTTTPSTSTTSLRSDYSRSSTLSTTNKPDDAKDKTSLHTYTRTHTSTKLNDEEKDKPKTYTRSYSSISEFKDTNNGAKKEPAVPTRTSFRSRLSKESPTPTTTTSTTADKAKAAVKKEEKGPPITFNTRYKSILPNRSRDPSPSVSTSSARDQSLSTLNSVKEKLSNSKYSSSSSVLSGSKEKTRDPSPAVSRRNSQTSQTQTALQRISAYRERSRSRDPSPSASAKKSSINNHTPIINKLSQNRSREPSPLAQKLSQLTAEFNSLEKLVARSRETSREPSPFLSNRSSNYLPSSSYSREQSPEKKYYRSSSNNIINNNNNASSNTSTMTTTTRKPSNKEDIKNSIYNRLSTSRRSSRETSPLEQIKSRFSQQYTPKTSTLNLNSGSSNDLSSTNSSSSLLPSRVSYINRHSPEKIKSPSPSKNNLNRQQQSKSDDIKTSESEDGKDAKNDDNDDESDSSSSCSTSTKTPSSTSKSEETSLISKKTRLSPPKTKIFIQVRTITRATSPHSTSTASTRLRRVEFAKTVEKVRQRALIGPQMLDKATQSDRLDDSARSSRFASSSSSSVYSSYSMRNSPSSSGRYSSKYSREIESTNDAREKRESSSCLSIDSLSIPSSTNRGTSISSRSSISVEKSRSTTPSHTVVVDTSTSAKCENKDYRKSTLNMGPTNRTIRSSSSSSDNPSSSVKETRKQLQQMWSNQDEFVREKSRGVENNLLEEKLEINENDVGEEEVENRRDDVASPTSREEKINQKIEEAKEFLIKTLGKAELSHSKSNNSQFSSKENDTDINGNYECNTLSQSQSEKSVVSEEINSKQDNNDEIISDTKSSSKWSWMDCNNNKLDFKKIERVESGEKPWWCRSPSVEREKDVVGNGEVEAVVSDKPIIPNDDSSNETKLTYEDCKHENFMESRTSPEGVEATHHDETELCSNDLMNRENEHNQFISKHRNIDDLLGKMSSSLNLLLNIRFLCRLFRAIDS